MAKAKSGKRFLDSALQNREGIVESIVESAIFSLDSADSAESTIEVMAVWLLYL